MGWLPSLPPLEPSELVVLVVLPPQCHHLLLLQPMVLQSLDLLWLMMLLSNHFYQQLTVVAQTKCMTPSISFCVARFWRREVK